ncbi:MAG: hypothetical protein LBH14_03975 [Desulfobulbaceae bacterium]|jgi:3-deoxy-D-manno-octulosonic-acid transferase|nr:hypothetical protein [Desulfobulbaceae bacterium]
MALYCFVIGLVSCLALPPLIIFSLITGWQRPGLRQRFGCYPALPAKTGASEAPHLWLHVASVGEARAALAFIAALRTQTSGRQTPGCDIVLTAMTVRGRDVAQRHLPDVPCFLAPLDVPWIVSRVAKRINPDLYIALESELWPVTLHTLRRRGCPVMLTNGRMTAKAAVGWSRFPWLFKAMVDAFAAIAVIGEEDRERFAALGARAGIITVAGNLKYDHRLNDDDQRKLRFLRGVCALNEEVLLGGSIHTGEEKALLATWRRLCQEKPLVLILAPRHLERLDELRAWLRREKTPWQDFSALLTGSPNGQRRQERLILVDTYGDLPILYGLADYVFIGGSLTPKGGHNPLEAALWAKAAWHGPDVRDFAAVYRRLDEANAAFMAQNSDELFRQISFYRHHPDAYHLAGQRAREIATGQQGAAERQAALALKTFANYARP